MIWTENYKMHQTIKSSKQTLISEALCYLDLPKPHQPLGAESLLPVKWFTFLMREGDKSTSTSFCTGTAIPTLLLLV